MASDKDPIEIQDAPESELGGAPSDIDDVWNETLSQITDTNNELTDQQIEAIFSTELDTSEGDEQSEWEQRFEAQINTFFDEAIARVPGFVDRHLKSFRRVMGRSISPKTGIGDVVIGMRNMFAGALKVVGGPDVSTTTYTHDKLTQDFEREVVGSAELESLLSRLFAEFEDDQWRRLASAYAEDGEQLDNPDDILEAVRSRLLERMEAEIAHDPLLAQALRSGVKIGIPATLGYVLFGKMSLGGQLGAATVSKLYKQRLNFYHRILLKLGKFEIPSWLGAVGWAGGMLGSLALGGMVEYALNSVRDIKGAYIRQLNTARYILLYGDNPDEAAGQGLLHVVRGLERQFERVTSLEMILPEQDELVGQQEE